jgi:hypothetical protein
MGQTPAIDAKAEMEVQTGYTWNIGDTVGSVLLTTASGIVAANMAGGYMVVENGTGVFHYYKVNTAVYTTGDTVLSVTLDEPIRVATDAGNSYISLYPNPWTGIIVTPTTVTGMCAGVTNGVVTADYYYWAQRKGPCAMIVDAGDTVVVGALVGLPGTHGTAGAAGIPAITTQIWGHCMGVAAAGDAALVYLNME